MVFFATTCMQTHFSPMASKFIPTSVILLVLFCLLLVKETSVAGCSSAYACFDANGGASLKEIRNRKMLSALKVSLQGSSRIKYGEKPLIGELRKVPSGPNPLHNKIIANPIRPETTH